MTSELWTEQNARHYDDNYPEMFSSQVLGPTVDFLARLADDGPALEFAIGTGRVGVPLAERGLLVSGIEMSQPMVDRLRTKASAEDISVVIGDMATATAPDAGTYRLVYLVFNTITNLLTQDAQVDCFANAARHLAPGGYFVIECFVPNLRRLPPGQTASPFSVTEDHLGFDTYDLTNQLLTSHHFRLDGDGFRRVASNHRYLWPSELDLMARLAGMQLVERVADWDGSPFDGESPSHVSVWRLPAG